MIIPTMAGMTVNVVFHIAFVILCLVNTADTQPSPPGVFVLYDGVGLMVKSLELVPAGPADAQMIRISSANLHYSSYQRRIVEIDIKGRIIWFGRRLSR